MTDAALTVTQSVVEQFTERYLRSLDCTIEKHGDTWDVTVPPEADTDLLTGDVTLRCDADTANSDNNMVLLHPESQFFQQMLTEVTERAPSGKITIDTEKTEITLPEWLQNSNITVSDVQFTPYYDRTAIVALFRVSIETVSEYQQEFLDAIAVDARSEELLPELEETFLRGTSPEGEFVEEDRTDLSREKVANLIDSTRDPLLERVQPQIDEIHQEASRAADAEIEEYHQMQEQRIQELEEKSSNLSSRIEELNEAIDNSEQKERVQALKERKQVKSEYDEVEAELTNIRDRREQGFPERQREIRERHALEVAISPLTVTQIEYERGEIEVRLGGERTTQTLTAGYGSGVGVAEDVYCTSCNRVFSTQNLPKISNEKIQCEKCV
jgi:uncharacterized coiled-coil protein SlyX